MADNDPSVLEHYQLATADPDVWPAEKDLSDASEDESTPAPAAGRQSTIGRTKSRYSALERSANDRRSQVPGSQKTSDGFENLVQKDEPDPLGAPASVVEILKQQGLPVQDDARLRNRFLLSSTTFSPGLFISQVHSTDSTQSLLRGLDVLSRSIDQKSASLKVLVESNFERFVRAKSTIDNVYNEMKSRGADPKTDRGSKRLSHSYRNSQVPVPLATPLHPTAPDSKRKNALAKESEYGVLGIKIPLVEVSAKAEEVWGPALGGKDKQESLKRVIANIERYKDYMDVNNTIAGCIKRKDHEALVEEYGRAKKFVDEARRTADSVAMTKSNPTDAQIQQLLVAARMWSDVDAKLEEFKTETWKRLTAMAGSATKDQQDQHMELIGVLLELGVQDNPIWVWLKSRADHLKSRIQASSDRSKVEIEVLRRRVANGEKPTPQMIASHIRSLGRHAPEKTSVMDSPEVIELWERMVAFLTSIISSQGLVGEVIDFWQTAQGFIEGTAQKTLPIGLDGVSRHHHRLSDDDISQLERETIAMVDTIRESVSSFFVDPPIEDISLLFSPIPSTPLTPQSAGLTPSGLRDPRFSFHGNNLPPPSPRRGESWETLAFWPPWSNSISGVHYLSKLLVIIGSGAGEMSVVSPVSQGDGSALERLRALVTSAREKSVMAILAAWSKDAENIKVVEDWKRSPAKKDVTKMPEYFMTFESAILTGMQKILYISDAMSRPGSQDVVLPPPAKLLQAVREQFVTTLYKAMSGMFENADRSVAKTDGGGLVTDTQGLTSPFTQITARNVGSDAFNATDRNVRKLLTLSNFSVLRSNTIPSLLTSFENAFSVKLTDQGARIRYTIGQIDIRLFESYVGPYAARLRSIIHNGILSPEWEPEPGVKPAEVRGYVYETLLAMVLVHTQVSTTSPSLTQRILSYLLEQASAALLEAFQQRNAQRKKVDLFQLMQATLDIEFIAQTLALYATDKASELQSAIYKELDHGTDDSARQSLQKELGEMRGVLKRLREGARGEFGCFRREKKRPGVKGRGESKAGGSMERVPALEPRERGSMNE